MRLSRVSPHRTSAGRTGYRFWCQGAVEIHLDARGHNAIGLERFRGSSRLVAAKDLRGRWVE